MDYPSHLRRLRGLTAAAGNTDLIVARNLMRTVLPSLNAAALAILANEPRTVVSQNRNHTTIERQVIATIW